MTETPRRGVFAGTVRPFIGPERTNYDSTVVTTRDSTTSRGASSNNATTAGST